MVLITLYVLQALNALIKLWQEDPSYKKIVVQKGLHDKLEYTIQSDVLPILKLTLKLLAAVYGIPELVEQVGINGTLNLIRRLMWLYPEVFSIHFHTGCNTKTEH